MSENDNSQSKDKSNPQISKVPSINEITHMAGKLFGDVKKSVTEIYQEYKQKRKEQEEALAKAQAANPSSQAQANTEVADVTPQAKPDDKQV